MALSAVGGLAVGMPRAGTHLELGPLAFPDLWYVFSSARSGDLGRG